ncbi:hypothetical protein RF11_06344 [Thelohanellus kitauei]|uniref:Uncharacterized protein n=1 Tax=Thelohanellus kitauei TaxID=669202 RepID=A0A0C2MYT6_THEKT|nr:hypothetical protein RF11_06344 [Thelohanellus kitauei]
MTILTHEFRRCWCLIQAIGTKYVSTVMLLTGALCKLLCLQFFRSSLTFKKGQTASGFQLVALKLAMKAMAASIQLALYLKIHSGPCTWKYLTMRNHLPAIRQLVTKQVVTRGTREGVDVVEIVGTVHDRCWTDIVALRSRSGFKSAWGGVENGDLPNCYKIITQNSASE